MHETQRLLSPSNGDHSQVSHFFAVLLEEIGKAVQDKGEEAVPRYPVPSSPMQRQTARPERLYTYD